jgi:hypothetical protein
LNIWRSEDVLIYKPIKSRYVKPLSMKELMRSWNSMTELRKQKFIELLLPSILVTKYEIFKENKRTIDIWAKLKSNSNINHQDSLFMEMLFA